MKSVAHDGPSAERSRRIGIAVDSCSLLTPDFIKSHKIAVAPMRINIADASFSDNPDIDYAAIYRGIALDPDLRAWVSAPVPDLWFKTITNAARNAETVLCLTVAAGLSASYDSARVAAQRFKETNPDIDIRVIDSGTISGALKLLAMEMVNVAERGLSVDGVIEHIQITKSTLRTIAALDDLSRIELIANTPKIALALARKLHIKPVVTFTSDEFRLVGKPISTKTAIRSMIRSIQEDICESPARFVILHVDAPDRAEAIATQISSRFNCQYIHISDFHPFIGMYAGRGAVGIAWQKLP